MEWSATQRSHMADKIIIRVQSPTGMKKILSTKKETSATFLMKVAREFGFNSNGFSVYLNRDKTGEILFQNKTLSLLNIKHGDMLFLFPLAAPSSSEAIGMARPHASSLPPSLSASASSSLSSRIPHSSGAQVQEDEIDRYLAKQDGKIYRNTDPQLCRHGALGKCVHCVPLEPFDEAYLNHLSPSVKHMSFHTYLRKLSGGADKGKFAALENISCKIKSGCEGHPPWPEGICTKCQPSAITLNRQKYRHVDNIMFENHTIADRFLDFWRNTGNQRMGYLYGRYTEYADIKLGIRAEVAAIYEPPQNSSGNYLELLEDPRAAVVDEMAAKLGLCKVGWIFTDLLCEDTRRGTVHYSRNKDSHFLSAEECITAAYFQNQYSNPCRFSRDGYFGSKFVTVLATGGPDNQVHFMGYQVSNQCMALVRDECLFPCKDAPELGYVRESTPELYVPDVFYSDKDKFGNDVTLLARPLPVEFFLIDITTTFPKKPKHTFISSQWFPIENRDAAGETQNLENVTKYLVPCASRSFLDIVSEFHLLLFLITNELIPLRDGMGQLLDAVKTCDEDLAQRWKTSEQWLTFEQKYMTVSEQPSGFMDTAGPSAHSSVSAMWSCLYCTFMNHPSTKYCAMCSLPC